MAIDVGEIRVWGGAAAPVGVTGTWLLCDGGSYLVATYPALFALVGYTFGGAGVNFNVPDLRNRLVLHPFPFGPGDDGLAEAARDPVTHQNLGAETGTNTFFADVHPAPVFTGGASVDVNGQFVAFPGISNVAGSGHSHGAPALNDHLLAESDHVHLQNNTPDMISWPPYLGLNAVICAAL